MTSTSWTAYGAGGMANQNVASDDARVDQQIGVNYGTTTFHRYETYHVNQDDPPERKRMVALNHLRGGAHRIAEHLLGELLRTGYGTTEIAYYYGLAVLGGRTLNEIDESVYRNFRMACQVGAVSPGDAWSVALEVVRRFMSSVWRQEVQGPLATGKVEELVGTFTSLDPERQDEITRALDLILGGAIQDQMEAVAVRRAVNERLQPNRAGRAWKFFEADPSPPRLSTSVRGTLENRTYGQLVGGALGVLLGLVLATTYEPVSTLLAILPLGLGGYLAVRFGAERAQLELRVARRNRQRGIPMVWQEAVSPGHWVSTAWVKDVHQRVDTSFRNARPHLEGDWDGATNGIREYLKARFVQVYGNAQVTPESINWLFRWHARRVARQWRAGTLFDYQAESQPSSRVIGMSALGIGLAALGLVVLAVGGLFGAAICLGGGGYFLALGSIAVMAAKRDDRESFAEDERTFVEEQQAYTEWLRVLSDRPTDAEMARWLTLDTAYLKTVALNRCGMTNRDLVAHVVMTEGMADARRARVIHGPVRYSAYVVLVFMLTNSGVREVEVDLDFLNGDVRNERRTSFRYDALASARVTERGVRKANDRAYGEQASDQDEPLEVVRLRSREFRLTLLNGEDIRVVVENFRGMVDTNLENEEYLLRLALATSGVASALHVLEAVAAEGRDWISREKERRERRSHEWGDGTQSTINPAIVELPSAREGDDDYPH